MAGVTGALIADAASLHDPEVPRVEAVSAAATGTPSTIPVCERPWMIQSAAMLPTGSSVLCPVRFSKGATTTRCGSSVGGAERVLAT
jgi:hypothetical protein